uniref:Uncharacterized protein n=1 Tax=Oryza meridionalis TaxID=40149 RepID=A0A0E0DQB4_9ORYZ
MQIAWNLKGKIAEEKEEYINKMHKRKKCKQSPSTLLCKYYMYKMLRVNGRYTSNPDNQILQIPYVANKFNKATVRNVRIDLCHFICHNCCNALGLFYDNESQLATEDQINPL